MVSRQQKRQLARAEERNGSSMAASPAPLQQWAESVDEVQVLGDLLLIEVLTPGESRGGIALPESYREEGPQRGIVVQTGPGALRDDGTHHPMVCQVGDRVYLQFPHRPMQMNFGGKLHLLIPDSSVIMKVAKKSEIVTA